MIFVRSQPLIDKVALISVSYRVSIAKKERLGKKKVNKFLDYTCSSYFPILDIRANI